jgi:hypothetical protein
MVYISVCIYTYIYTVYILYVKIYMVYLKIRSSKKMDLKDTIPYKPYISHPALFLLITDAPLKGAKFNSTGRVYHF